MTDELLISNVTNEGIGRILKKPAHALLLIGVTGIGKNTIARYIASKLLNLESMEKLGSYPYFYTIAQENNLVTIDQIRQLREIFRLKTTGKMPIRRVVIIDGANFMNNEAQNALLKLLEEPPTDSVLILTSDSETNLKATVVSRTQILRLHRPSLNQATEYFTALDYKEDDIKKAYLFSAGATGMMSLILSEKEASSLLLYLNEAKSLLSVDRFNKLLKVDEWSKDKPTLPWKLYALKRVCNAALMQSIEKNQPNLIRHWHKCQKAVLNSEADLSHNANAKLLLTNLFMDL